MNTKYINALKQLRGREADLKSPFSERLFGHDWSYGVPVSQEQVIEAKVADSPAVEVKVEEKAEKSVTEKVKMLDELHKFGKEKFEQTKSDKIHLGNGAVIQKKQAKNPRWDFASSAINEYMDFYQTHSNDLYNDKSQVESENIDVLFIVDEEFLNHNIASVTDKKISVFFEEDVAILFQKMIKAMQLDGARYSISTCSDLVEKSDEYLFAEIYHRRPKYLVSLGGFVSSKLLKTKERLQALRGKFYKIEIENKDTQEVIEYELLPLFSPNYLNEAPNSKRLAWEDMQKLMSKLV